MVREKTVFGRAVHELRHRAFGGLPVGRHALIGDATKEQHARRAQLLDREGLKFNSQLFAPSKNPSSEITFH
jgi:hypothetical protein